MKIIVLLSIFYLAVFSCKRDNRTVNFPKAIEFVENMPHPDSLWVFILAGQSNMAGRALVEPQDTVSSSRILTINQTGKWIYAKEPIHFYEPKASGLDCGLSFAKELLNVFPNGISIGIIPCAIGGTSIEQWIADDIHQGVPLLSNLKSKVDTSQKYGTIKGILWHQGESNTKMEQIPNYSKGLQHLTKALRVIINDSDLPILIGQLGSFAEPLEKQKRWDAINAITEEFAQSNANTYLITTEDFKDKGDHVHFDSKSIRELGRRFARKYSNISNPNAEKRYRIGE